MTIEEEVLDILADEVDGGRRVNEIVDEFRCGRSAACLLELLDSGDGEVVSIGAWILGELPFEIYCYDKFISRLRELTRHPHHSVRFHALGALFPALDAADPATRRLLETLLRDPNEGVRQAAKAAYTQLSFR